MTDDSEVKDRKALAKLVRRQGLTWVIENGRQIDTEPQTKLGKPSVQHRIRLGVC